MLVLWVIKPLAAATSCFDGVGGGVGSMGSVGLLPEKALLILSAETGPGICKAGEFFFYPRVSRRSISPKLRDLVSLPTSPRAGKLPEKPTKLSSEISATKFYEPHGNTTSDMDDLRAIERRRS